jgi:hypothetical protein
MKRRIFGLLVFFIFLFLPSQASANIGLPMIFVSYPIMLVALIPIIVFEGYLSAKLLKLRFKKSLVPSSLANCVSTILGFPLAWLLLLWFQVSATGGGCGPGFDTTFDSVITIIVGAITESCVSVEI